MRSAVKTRPVRLPPPAMAATEYHSISLPVLHGYPTSAGEDTGGTGQHRQDACATKAALPAGDPFSPHKILNHFDRLRRFVAGELVSPITVEIDPTNLCNHRCQWCVSTESHTGEVLPVARLAELAAELKRSDVRSIVLKGGGEPTTHPQFIEILEIMQEQGLATGLITNGSMPRAGSVEKIVETCEWVRVSLDAATAETHRAIHGTGDFHKIVANVERMTELARDNRPMVGLNFVAEQRNCGEMVAFARMARELGAAYVTIRCVFDPANPPAEDVRTAMRDQAISAKGEERAGFRVFLGNFTDRYINATAGDAFPHARCLGPNLIGVVGGDGHVYACCFLRGNRRFSFGSVHEQTFGQIWSGQRRQEVMRAVYAGQCNRVCAGGLTANRYNTYNEILNYMAAEAKPHGNFA